jgi:hypothetical protein
MKFTIDELNSIKNLTDLLITDDCWTIFFADFEFY